MSQLKQNAHDFSAKLRQKSLIDRFRQYVHWQRTVRQQNPQAQVPDMAPVSINLDLTTACNFACPHCVDSGIINSGQQLSLDTVKQSIDTLADHGLLSIILLGGGEPLLYPQVEEVVAYIKEKGLQLGVVTNGSKPDKLAAIAPMLQRHDWIRLSLDAATEQVFDKLHCPRIRVDLATILQGAQQAKAANSQVSWGYSFVIMWPGLRYNGTELAPNVHQMAQAAQLARQYGFDYISFKPCLIRLPDIQQESLLDGVDQQQERAIVETIRQHLEAARQEQTDSFKVLESVNLVAMLEGRVAQMKQQPRTCHMHVFNSVLTPEGIFHCPAFRGVASAKIGSAQGYAGEEAFAATLSRLRESICSFNADKECDRIACFYNHVNWWMENFVSSGEAVEDLQPVADDNFFF